MISEEGGMEEERERGGREREGKVGKVRVMKEKERRER